VQHTECDARVFTRIKTQHATILSIMQVRYYRLGSHCERRSTIRISDVIHIITGQPKGVLYRQDDNPTSGVGNYTETRAYCATDQRRYGNAEEDSDMEEELKDLTWAEHLELARRARIGETMDLHRATNRMRTPLASDAESDSDEDPATAISSMSRRRMRLPKPVAEKQDPAQVMRSGLNAWLTRRGYARHDHVRYTDEQATQLHRLEQEQRRQARRTEVERNANRIMAEDYIPVEPVRNVRARLGFENASPRATDRRAGEDPEQTESDQAPPAQNRLAAEIRAERERQRMTPAQVSAFNAVLGIGQPIAAPQDDDVQDHDDVVGDSACP
jgi:hypothetical protein